MDVETIARVLSSDDFEMLVWMVGDEMEMAYDECTQSRTPADFAQSRDEYIAYRRIMNALTPDNALLDAYPDDVSAPWDGS